MYSRHLFSYCGLRHPARARAPFSHPHMHFWHNKPLQTPTAGSQFFLRVRSRPISARKWSVPGKYLKRFTEIPRLKLRAGRACHKLPGNFLATFRISSNFFCFEQFFAFWAISSFLDIGAAFSALIDHASIFCNVSVNNFWISCEKGAVPPPPTPPSPPPPGQIMGERCMQPGC